MIRKYPLRSASLSAIGVPKSPGIRVIAAEAAAVLSGIVLLIGCEYALDKTDWSPVLIYAVMILILALLAFLLIRRIRTEDRAA